MHNILLTTEQNFKMLPSHTERHNVQLATSALVSHTWSNKSWVTVSKVPSECKFFICYDIPIQKYVFCGTTVACSFPVYAGLAQELLVPEALGQTVMSPHNKVSLASSSLDRRERGAEEETWRRVVG